MEPQSGLRLLYKYKGTTVGYQKHMSVNKCASKEHPLPLSFVHLKSRRLFMVNTVVCRCRCQLFKKTSNLTSNLLSDEIVNLLLKLGVVAAQSAGDWDEKQRVLCSSPCEENNLKGSIELSAYSGVYPVFVYLQLVEGF